MPMQQPNNPIVDIADVTAKLAPLLFGKTQTQSESGQIDPAALAQSNQLFAALTKAGTSVPDNLIQDILYRAQLAFSPVLGEEKVAGLYNSTTRDLLGKEAIARATAASAAAVVQQQQEAMRTAAEIAKSQIQASSGKKATVKDQGQLVNLLKSVGVGVGSKEVVKGVKAIVGKLGGNDAANAATDKEFASDVDQYFVDSEQAGEPIFAGGDAGAFGEASGEAGEVSNASFADALTPMERGLINADDPLGLTNAAATSTTSSAVAGGTTDTTQTTQQSSLGISPTSAVSAATSAGVTSTDAATIGPIAVQKAAEAAGYGVNPATGLPYPMPAADPSAAADLTGLTDTSALDSASVVAPDAVNGADFVGSAGAPVGMIATGALNTVNNPEVNLESSALGGPVGLTDQFVQNPGDTIANTLDTTVTAAQDTGQQVIDASTSDAGIIGQATTKVICTESVAQGLMADALRKQEMYVNFVERKISRFTCRGYHYLAIPVVQKMRIDRAYAEYMASWANAYCKHITGEKKSFAGWCVKNIGERICWVIGIFVQPDLKVLYAGNN